MRGVGSDMEWMRGIGSDIRCGGINIHYKGLIIPAYQYFLFFGDILNVSLNSTILRRVSSYIDIIPHFLG